MSHLASSPSSSDRVTCGTAPPTFTLTGTISSDQAVQVTYQWARSDGSTTGPETIPLSAGMTQTVTDQVTTASDTYTGGDTLDITSPSTISQPISLAVSCQDPLTISTGSLPAGMDGAPYSATVTATGGDNDYTWSATGLPPGLVIGSATGVISGTPTQAGPYTVAVTVSDATRPRLQPATANLSLTVSGPLTISTGSLPAGLPGGSYSATVTATGGDGAYTWSASGLPSGMTIDPATGTISGPLPAKPGTYPFTVSVTDGETPPQSISNTLALVVGET